MASGQPLMPSAGTWRRPQCCQPHRGALHKDDQRDQGEIIHAILPPLSY
jgi:hypothetical protein